MESRVDPYYYQPAFQEAINVLRTGKYPLFTVGELCREMVHPAEFPREYSSERDGLPFVRAGDVRDGQLNLMDLPFVLKDTLRSFPQSRLRVGDVLIVRTGAKAGEVAMFAESRGEYYASSHTLLLRAKANVNPRYLEQFLVSRFGKEQILRRLTGAAQRQLQKPTIASIRIPLPPRPIQDAIAAKMDAAYQRKRELEAEAEALLESIDGYVLGELGIELPEPVEEKCFTQWANEVRGGRLDSYYYLPRFTRSLAACRESIYPLKPLEYLTTSISGGSTPRGAQYPDKGIPFLRIQNIADGVIDLSDIKYISPETHEKMKRSQLRPLDLLMTITGRVGTCAVVPEDFGDGNINQHIVRMSVTAELDPYYAAEVLNSPIGRLQTERSVTGTTRIALDYPTILQIRIPVPPLGKQRDIAAEVRRRREQAAVLQKEAERVVAEAKAEVERMILGEEEI